MAYPTTLALITALWSGAGADAVDRAVVGDSAARSPRCGPLVAGFLLEHFRWGSVFLVTLPLAAVALFMAWRFVPAHVNEIDRAGRQPRRHPVTRSLVGALILAINFAPVPDMGNARRSDWRSSSSSRVSLFVIRQRRAANPLYDLEIAAARIFWVAAVAGIIVFGSLMGAMFIGQQFLQNVLGYSTLDAGLSILPAGARAWSSSRPRSAKLVEATGRAVHAAPRLRLRAARLPARCCSCGRRASRTGRSGSATRSSASASGSPARRPRTR